MNPLTPVLLGLEAELNVAGWDQPCGVYWIVGGAGGLEACKLPLSAATWSGPRPYVHLLTLASFGPPTMADDIVAVAYHWEQWIVKTPMSDTAAIERGFADAAARQIRNRPDRTDARSVYAIDRARQLHAVFRVRGEPPSMAAGPDRDPGGYETLGGDIIDCLAALAAATMGTGP